MRCILSIDVEDWFHILDVPGAPGISEWERLPSRVEVGMRKLLEILATANSRATFFFLGWIAERNPHLVLETRDCGHEIASHGYSHDLVYRMGADRFFEDARRSKAILEDITGKRVLGFRASGFSLTEATPWFFDKLMEAGYAYDSSLFPAPRQHGGMRVTARAPFKITDAPRPFYEFPISVVNIFGKPLCLFGGGYLRLFPYRLIRKMAQKVLGEHRPVIFYIHPREVDPEHPRMQMPLLRRFKSYVNLTTTEPKLRNILRDFEITSFEDFIRRDLGERVGE